MSKLASDISNMSSPQDYEEVRFMCFIGSSCNVLHRTLVTGMEQSKAVAK
jgi:hypothetical protein